MIGVFLSPSLCVCVCDTVCVLCACDVVQFEAYLADYYQIDCNMTLSVYLYAHCLEP